MHNATMLWAGEVADLLDMSPEERETHERRRVEMFRGVVEDGEIHSQPFSEGLNPGALAGVGTKAERVPGGYRVTGCKIFASLPGAANRYNVTCQVPNEDTMVSAWAAVYTVMEHASEVVRTAVRVCGGQSMLKHLPLERMYRDSRLGSTMLPWSAEVALDRIG